MRENSPICGSLPRPRTHLRCWCRVRLRGVAAGGGKVIKPAHLKAAVASDPKFDSLKDLVEGIPDPAAAAGGKGANAAAACAVPAESARPAVRKRAGDQRANSAGPKKRKTLAGRATVTAPGAVGPVAGLVQLADNAGGAQGKNENESALCKAMRITAQAARAAVSDDDYDDDSA